MDDPNCLERLDNCSRYPGHGQTVYNPFQITKFDRTSQSHRVMKQLHICETPQTNPIRPTDALCGIISGICCSNCSKLPGNRFPYDLPTLLSCMVDQQVVTGTIQRSEDGCNHNGSGTCLMREGIQTLFELILAMAKVEVKTWNKIPLHNFYAHQNSLQHRVCCA